MGVCRWLSMVADVAVTVAVRRARVQVDTDAHMRGRGDVDAILAALATDWGARLHARVVVRGPAVSGQPRCA